VRFPCMSDAYDRELQQMAADVGQELGYGDFLRDGVYCVLGGPSFETIAESRMLHKLGADAVGGSRLTDWERRKMRCCHGAAGMSGGGMERKKRERWDERERERHGA